MTAGGENDLKSLDKHLNNMISIETRSKGGVSLCIIFVSFVLSSIDVLVTIIMS